MAESTPNLGNQRIALIGWGAIARSVVRRLELAAQAGPTGVDTVAVLVRDVTAAAQQDPQHAGLFVDSLDALLAHQPTLVVECAGHSAVVAYGQAVLRAGVDLLLVSVGALSDDGLAAALSDAAAQSKRQIVLASGAVGGLDWLSAARMAGLDSVTYRGRKPPGAWAGADADRLIDRSRADELQVFFRGTARQAAAQFPKNANVAATVALASLGLDAVRVELIADPAVSDNVHEVEAQSTAGHMHIRIQGRPDADNPRTSAITAHSVVHAVLRRSARWVV